MIKRLILTALALAVFATQAMAYGSISVGTPSMGVTLSAGPPPPPPPPVYVAPPPPPGYHAPAYPLPPGQARKYWRRHGHYPPPPPPPPPAPRYKHRHW
ncbi:hypothetical protein JCM15519_13580 [Fundidesulfovibrio butyratiphilus]